MMIEYFCVIMIIAIPVIVIAGANIIMDWVKNPYKNK